MSERSESTRRPHGAVPRERRCMVVGCDRSPSSRVAAEWAARQMRGVGTVVLVHACRPLMLPPAALSTPEERIEIGHAVIDEMLMEAGAALLDVDLEIEVLDEDPVRALLESVSARTAEAIAIGSEHGSRLRSAIGTITEGLLKAAVVPVIAVPEPAAAPARSTGQPPPRP
jgi:nucleotide-binding universal stress UspA family protein